MLSIVFALGSGLYYLLSKDRSEQMVKALTVRISLSFGLFLLLIFCYVMGWLKPHNAFWSTANKQTQKGITTPHPQSANTTPPLQMQNGAQD